MKKFLTLLLVLTVVASAVRANEIDKPKTPVGVSVMKSGSVYKLFYKGGKPADVKVTILNEEGKAIYKETIRNIESFMRPYNFSSIGEGNYTIALEGEDGKQLQKISYFKNNEEKLMSLVRLAGSENKYVLSVANKGSDELRVKIYDSKDNQVYSGTEKIEGDFAKIYTLNKLGKDFSFEITSKDGVTQTLEYNR